MIRMLGVNFNSIFLISMSRVDSVTFIGCNKYKCNFISSKHFIFFANYDALDVKRVKRLWQSIKVSIL